MTNRAAAARALAAQAVDAVQRGRTLDAALEQTFARLPAALAGERALIQEISYGTLRWLLQLERLLRGFLDKPLKEKDGDLHALLLIGLYQLLHMRVAPHAAVKETVEATRVLKKDWAKGLTNAVLRRVQREEKEIRTRLEQDELLGLAHPPWLLARLKESYPDHWRTIANANNSRPPMTLRVHLGKITRDACIAKLAQAGITAHVLQEVPGAIILETPAPVDALPGFRAGELSVQDAGAQLAAELLDVRPGMHVLDACAAPGGKAAHVLERVPDTTLVALDVDGARLMRVRENFARLGLHGTILKGDAANPGGWWDGRPFDRILLDAPCSATGVIRRHPDIRLHRTPEDITHLAETQARLLDGLWPLLAPGGKLLYVTCSILPEENSRQIKAFLARQPLAREERLSHPALERYAQHDHLGWQLLPGSGDMDGFYYAGLAPHRTEA